MKKSAHYRQCIWHTHEDLVFSDVLDASYVELATDQNIADCPLEDGLRCIARRYNAGNGRFFYHFITYEEDSHAAVVSIIDVGVDEIPPAEDDTEFIESQIFLLIEMDQVLYTTHNKPLRDGSINGVLLGFIRRALGSPYDQFLLMPKFNEEQIVEVFEGGIDHIDLGLGSFAQTIEFLRSGGRIPAANPLAPILNFLAERDEEEMAAAENVSNKLILKAGRNWNRDNVKELLSGVALTVTEEFQEEFAIVTKSGVRVTHEKITVKEAIEVRGNTRVLNVGEVRIKITEAFERLREANVLEA